MAEGLKEAIWPALCQGVEKLEVLLRIGSQ